MSDMPCPHHLAEIICCAGHHDHPTGGPSLPDRIHRERAHEFDRPEGNEWTAYGHRLLLEVLPRETAGCRTS